MKEVKICFVMMEQERFLIGLDALVDFGFTWEWSCECSPARSGCSEHVLVRFVSTRAARVVHKCVGESKCLCSRLTGFTQEKVVDGTKVRSSATGINVLHGTGRQWVKRMLWEWKILFQQGRCNANR